MQWRQSSAAHWSVGLSIVAVVVLALLLGRKRQVQRSGPWVSAAARGVAGWRRTLLLSAGVAVWAILVTAIVAWDLTSFISQSHELPTLSYEIGRVTRWHWGRTVVFAAWLAVGIALACACLVPRRRRPMDPSPRQPPQRR